MNKPKRCAGICPACGSEISHIAQVIFKMKTMFMNVCVMTANKSL